MRRRSLALPIVLACFCLACDDDVVDQPRILATEIDQSALPQLDASRTYLYSPGLSENPEGLVRWLWEQGVHPRRAWQPIPDGSICLAVLPNPSFTVELDAPDGRMADYRFYASTQGLKCASRYRSFTVMD
jgi:hypothetical protein